MMLQVIAFLPNKSSPKYLFKKGLLSRESLEEILITLIFVIFESKVSMENLGDQCWSHEAKRQNETFILTNVHNDERYLNLERFKLS